MGMRVSRAAGLDGQFGVAAQAMRHILVDYARSKQYAKRGGDAPKVSLDEALTVYALVNALTVNMPDISAVQILVDGKEVDTLAGHVDLRHPLARSLKWVRKGQ